MSGPALLDAVTDVPHLHTHLHHPQTGNPFFDWWSAARFRCELCLAVMRDSGADVALAFARALPWRLEYDFDRQWWRDAYLATLRFVEDPNDREYMRDRLADATRRGRTAR